jgi:receptor protein-tyrosine kinase
VNGPASSLNHPDDHVFRRELIHARAFPAADSPDLAAVPSVNAAIAPETRLVMYNDASSMGADRFRLLRVYLRALAENRELKTLMVTSAMPREGKSTAALNLATGLAERNGTTVVLVEADLRHPSQTARLGLSPWPGLVHCVEHRVDPLSAIRRVNPLGIYLLPAGQIAPNPIETLNCEGFVEVMHRLRGLADWVIVDAPPTIPVPDVLAIRPIADGCLWVARAHVTQRDLVKDAMHQVGADMILGMILNEAEDLEKSYSHYYHHPSAGLLPHGS